MRLVSGRPSDVRDIAALILQNGIPKDTKQRVKEIMPYPTVFGKNLQDRVIADISEKRFADSWRGTFVTRGFNERIKDKVLDQVQRLILEVA